MINKISLIMIATVLLFCPKVNYSQSPDLGTASEFTLFTADGAFTNYGESYVTGDVGTNIGEFSGFPPGVVNGDIHVANATSSQAAIDVIAAYDHLAGLTCGTVLGLTIGSSQILTPDIYCIGAGGATLNDTLFLDAQGDPNALFIIKIDGAFSTGNLSNVVLINSANFDNVYWQINGAVEVGESAFFRGNILANGAINLLLNSSLQGRALSRAGAINIYTINATFQSDLLLPITLLHFSVSKEQSYISFSWSTSSEINNDYFTLERSIDAVNFITIGKTNGAGNSNTLLHYSVNDYHPTEGLSYYRLKQTDLDGNYEYFKPEAVSFEPLSNNLSVYPNPASETLYISGLQIRCEQLQLFNALGQNVISSTPIEYSTQNNLSLNLINLPQGLYILKYGGVSRMFYKQ